MTERPDYAPGCFGGISTYAEDEVCTPCPHNAACKVVHLRALRQFRDFHGIVVKEPTRQVGELPVKVKKLFNELGKSAEEVRSMMLAGLNPYSLRAGFVGILCHVLLTRKRATRAYMTEVLMAHRKYNELTADVYTRHTIQILKHCGVVQQQGDEVVLVTFDGQKDK